MRSACLMVGHRRWRLRVAPRRDTVLPAVADSAAARIGVGHDLPASCLARSMLRYEAPACLQRGASHATRSSLHRGGSTFADPRRPRGVGGGRTTGPPPERRGSDSRPAVIVRISGAHGRAAPRPALPASAPRARIGSPGAASLGRRRAAAITQGSWDGPTHDVRATRHRPTARPRHDRSWRWRGAARRRTRGWPRRAPIAAPGRRSGRGTERFGPRGPQDTESPPTG